jgi:hypothetical protein
MPCSTLKKSVVLVAAVAILVVGLLGAYLMFEALHIEDADDFMNELFMQALGLMMLAVTCWIPIQPTLKAVMQCTKTKKGETSESILTKTGKMRAFQQKGVGQQA